MSSKSKNIFLALKQNLVPFNQLFPKPPLVSDKGQSVFIPRNLTILMNSEK